MGDITVEEHSEGAREYWTKLFQSGVCVRDDQTGEIIYVDVDRVVTITPDLATKLHSRHVSDTHPDAAKLVQALEESFPICDLLTSS